MLNLSFRFKHQVLQSFPTWVHRYGDRRARGLPSFQLGSCKKPVVQGENVQKPLGPISLYFYCDVIAGTVKYSRTFSGGLKRSSTGRMMNRSVYLRNLSTQQKANTEHCSFRGFQQVPSHPSDFSCFLSLKVFTLYCLLSQPLIDIISLLPELGPSCAC